MDESIIEKAIQIIRQGGIVIYPTDTAFAIGCRIDDEAAVKKLFEIRKRPVTQAVPVLVSNFSMASNYWREIPDDVKRKLITPYWPGALTIILNCLTQKIPVLVRGGSDTLGLRMPNHNIAIKLISGVGVPLLGPSANFHGENTPYEYEKLDKKLVKLVDFVVPGICQTKYVSTVIDCTVKPWNVIREGAVQLVNS